MSVKTIRLYHPIAAEPVAVVSAEPAWKEPGTFLIRVGRGTAGNLSLGTSYGPVPEAELPARFEVVVDSLRAEGYLPGGLGPALAGLQSKNSQTRARAASRLGRMRAPEAVNPLLDALQSAGDDACTIIDALGEIGHPHAAAALRTFAARKLLSRRRSAVEALRQIGDQEGLAQAAEVARGRLPEAVRAKLGSPVDTAGLRQTLEALAVKEQGLALDLLYEIDDPVGNEAVRRVLGEIQLGQRHLWRYVKSILKRAMLRHDPVTLGLLAHAVEHQGRTSSGTSAMVKSGYDGKPRQTRIFSRKTQNYLRRAVWRHLRTLARHRPELYTAAAAEAIIHYSPEDADLPRKRYGQFARCYLLHQVLWGQSRRFQVDSFSLRTRFRGSAQVVGPDKPVREEAFPELWDAYPRPFMRLLGAARLAEVQAFALRAVEGPHRRLIALASLAELLPLIDAPHEPTVRLCLAELERRFDPAAPDWTLIERLLTDGREALRTLGHRFLERCGVAWTAEAERVLRLLGAPHADTRNVVAEVCLRAAGSWGAAHREELAREILTRLRAGEPEPEAHAGYARVACEALAAELGALLTVADLAALIDAGSPSARAVAGHLLGGREQAIAELGLPRIMGLAGHELVAVRRGAHALLRAAVPQLRQDPSLLFALAESEWEDTRQLAFEILRDRIDLATLGFDGLIGLCDSNRVDVQALGEELVRQHFAELKVHDLIYRLAEHPHPNMRRFALDLVIAHLKEGFTPLAKVEPLFRQILLDLWPSARDKARLIAFLAERGLCDEQQAGVVAGILTELLRTDTRRDFEGMLGALARLKLAYPALETDLHLWPGGAP